MKLLALFLLTFHIEVVDELNPEFVPFYLDYACEITGGVCPGVPTVYYTATRVGVWGFQYGGSDYVFMTDRCMYSDTDVDKCDGVLVHELVHYVLGKQGRLQDNSCANEQMAWGAYNMYELEVGRPENVNLDWRNSYPRCK